MVIAIIIRFPTSKKNFQPSKYLQLSYLGNSKLKTLQKEELEKNNQQLRTGILTAKMEHEMSYKA